MKHQIDIASNNAIYIDGKRVVGRKPYGFFETKTIRITNSDLVEIANRCDELMKIDDAPTADVPERNVGEWIITED